MIPTPKAIQKLLEIHGKFNLLRTNKLIGSKIAIIQAKNLYLSPAMMQLAKSKEPIQAKKFLETLKVYKMDRGEFLSSVAMKLKCMK